MGGKGGLVFPVLHGLYGEDGTGAGTRHLWQTLPMCSGVGVAIFRAVSMDK